MKRKQDLPSSDILSWVPDDAWRRILYYGGIAVTLQVICKRWTKLAFQNSDALLTEWLAEEAEKPCYEDPAQEGKSNAYDSRNVNLGAGTYYQSRAACRRLIGLTPSWTFYHTVTRLYELEHARFTQYSLKWRPRDSDIDRAPLSTIYIVYYASDHATYYILSFEHYKHLLVAYDRYGNPLPQAPNRYMQYRHVKLINGSRLVYPCTLFNVFLHEKEATIAVGHVHHRIGDRMLYEQLKTSRHLHTVYVADGWTLDDICGYLQKYINYEQDMGQLRLRLDSFTPKYEIVRQKKWIAYCTRRANEIRINDIVSGTDPSINEWRCQFLARGFYATVIQQTHLATDPLAKRWLHRRAFLCFYTSETLAQHLYMRLSGDSELVFDGSPVLAYNDSMAGDDVLLCGDLCEACARLCDRVLSGTDIGLIDCPVHIPLRSVCLLARWDCKTPLFFRQLISLLDDILVEHGLSLSEDLENK